MTITKIINILFLAQSFDHADFQKILLENCEELCHHFMITTVQS